MKTTVLLRPDFTKLNDVYIFSCKTNLSVYVVYIVYYNTS